MKKFLIIILFLFFIIPSISYSDENVIYIVDATTWEIYGEMTEKQFTTLVDGADYTKEMLQAEKDNRIRITTKDNIWNLDNKKQFKTNLTIDWLNEENYVFKSLTIKVVLTVEKINGISYIRELYRDIAEIGFLIETVLLILIIIIAI